MLLAEIEKFTIKALADIDALSLNQFKTGVIERFCHELDDSENLVTMESPGEIALIEQIESHDLLRKPDPTNY